MRRTSDVALRAGVYIVLGAISGFVAAYALKEIVHRLHDSTHDSKSLKDHDEDDDSESTDGPRMTLNELVAKHPEMRSKIDECLKGFDEALAELNDFSQRNWAQPTVIIDASPEPANRQTGGDLPAPTRPAAPEDPGPQDTLPTESAHATFQSEYASPPSSSNLHPGGITNPKSSPTSYNLTNAPSLAGTQPGPAESSSVPTLLPLSMPSDAPPSSDSSPTDFFSPTSSIDTFLSPLSPSQAWLKLEHGDRDELMEGEPFLTDHDTDPVSPFHTRLVAARRAIRAHDVFAASFISFSELGSLVGNDSGVLNEEPGGEDADSCSR
ncbi:hypothetical protein F5I97DRAFT_1927241 [Phlebopus sp. FC_14]|nr:hypothetical protein F5I97DRAFT_1927241 [Phlebopus sp. FC_14]